MRNLLLILLLSLSFSAFGFDYLPANETEPPYHLYTDEKDKIIYIDFKSIKWNVSFVVIKDFDGKMVIKEDVTKLPVNLIYELDYSDFLAGEYSIELHSRSEILTRKLKLK